MKKLLATLAITAGLLVGGMAVIPSASADGPCASGSTQVTTIYVPGRGVYAVCVNFKTLNAVLVLIGPD